MDEDRKPTTQSGNEELLREIRDRHAVDIERREGRVFLLSVSEPV